MASEHHVERVDVRRQAPIGLELDVVEDHHAIGVDVGEWVIRVAHDERAVKAALDLFVGAHVRVVPKRPRIARDEVVHERASR